jgi:hypothetical protein
MWIVRLLKKPTLNDFRDNFFPRREYFKKDAQALKKEVIEKGGDADIKREASIPRKRKVTL